jgi:hypothetical protein
MSVGTSEPLGEIELDAFAYVPDMASHIAGLGGQDRPAEGDYVFHTPYVGVAEGIAHFRLVVEGLKATSGALSLRVHMLSPESQHARLTTSDRIAFNRLAQADGRIDIRFEAFQGVTYALYGGVIGDTDAEASAIRVTLDRPADASAPRPARAAEARDTEYGSATIAVPFIVSLAPARLASPVIQLATGAQLHEADALWRLPARVADPLDRWRMAYVMQAVKSYGFMETGARGLALGRGGDRIASLLAEEGCSIDRALLAGDGGADPVALEDIVNYDFLWTEGACDRKGSAATGVRFAEATLACLRPGGLAVHLVDYDMDDRSSGRFFRREDVERLSLILISRGHSVAEFRIDSSDLLIDARGYSACGIVCRRAPMGA